MFELILLFFVVFITFFFIYNKIFVERTWEGSPPGPKPWPLLGNILQLDRQRPYKTVDEWAKKFGPIFRMYSGSELIIVLSSIEVAKEAFIKNADIYAGRPTNFVFNQALEGKRGGIVNIDGPVWKQQRRFALQTLRDFGFGKSIVESKIQYEIENLLEWIDRKISNEENKIDIVVPLKFATANIITSILMGKTFEHGDQEFIKYQACISENIHLLGKAQIINIFPPIRYLVPGAFGFWKVLENLAVTKEFLNKEIQKHQREIKAKRETEVTDFCHAYLVEMERLEAAGDPDANMFNLDQLLGVIGDLFVAGHETSVTTLSWAIAYMINYPDIQERCYQEIAKSGSLPSFEDRKNMNYVQAVLLESQRCGNIVPFGVPHATLDASKLSGYKIPKGATVMLNMAAVFNDAEHFPEPEKFNPDRFLDASGQLIIPEAMVPFSLGKRVCLGESLAKVEMFLLFTALVYHYKMSSGDGTMPVLEPVFGFILTPPPYTVKFEKRKSL